MSEWLSCAWLPEGLNPNNRLPVITIKGNAITSSCNGTGGLSLPASFLPSCWKNQGQRTLSNLSKGPVCLNMHLLVFEMLWVTKTSAWDKQRWQKHKFLEQDWSQLEGTPDSKVTTSICVANWHSPSVPDNVTLLRMWTSFLLCKVPDAALVWLLQSLFKPMSSLLFQTSAHSALIHGSHFNFSFTAVPVLQRHKLHCTAVS